MPARAQATDDRAPQPLAAAARRDEPLRGNAAFVWRIAVTGVCLVLGLFAWHDAFMVHLGDPWHFNPFAPDRFGWPDRFEALVRLSMLVFALLVAWRSRSNESARLLTWGLIGASADIYWEWYGNADHQAWVLFPLVLKYVGTSFGLMQLIRFAARFGAGDIKGMRTWIDRFAWLAFVVPCFSGLASQILPLPPWLNPIPGWDSTYLNSADLKVLHAFYLVSDALAKLAMIAAAAIGLHLATPEDKEKHSVVVLAFVAYGIGTALHFLAFAAFGDSVVLRGMDAFFTLMLPIGLVSAARTSLFMDVELFIDPAIAFGLVVMVVALVLYVVDERGQFVVENLAGFAQNIFEGSSILPSIAAWFVTFALGAVLIVTVNFFHDRIVERARSAIFPGRAERIEALENDLSLIVLSRDLRQFKATLQNALIQHAKARYIQVYVKDSHGRFAPIMAAPHDGLVELSGAEWEIDRMRQRKSWVQLDDNPSPIKGTIAFPMLISGSLIGFVVCGPSTVQARYGNDEIQNLEAIARVAGATLTVLQRHGA